jgi:ElaB/YqjD/DUF883 family membrane-anchored ribosome-binding protein
MATREPEEIRREIDQTREELGETVEALATKADVKAQARAKVDETKERFSRKAEDAKEKIAGASPDQAKAAASNVATTATDRPMPFMVAGAFAAGLILGLLVARRRG